LAAALAGEVHLPALHGRGTGITLLGLLSDNYRKLACGYGSAAELICGANCRTLVVCVLIDGNGVPVVMHKPCVWVDQFLGGCPA
jgi:hypothetical protein